MLMMEQVTRADLAPLSFRGLIIQSTVENVDDPDHCWEEEVDIIVHPLHAPCLRKHPRPDQRDQWCIKADQIGYEPQGISFLVQVPQSNSRILRINQDFFFRTPKMVARSSLEIHDSLSLSNRIILVLILI